MTVQYHVVDLSPVVDDDIQVINDVGEGRQYVSERKQKRGTVLKLGTNDDHRFLQVL
jgi:hypothetical protein